MSYSYPTKRFWVPADVDSVAAFLAERQGPTAIRADGGSQPVPALSSDLSLAYMRGMADGILCAGSVQVTQFIQMVTVAAQSPLDFTDVTQSQWTFTPPITRRYMFRCDFSFLFTPGGPAPGVYVRMAVGSVPLAGPVYFVNSPGGGLVLPMHVMGNFDLTGNTSYVVRMQAKVKSSGNGVATNDDCVAFWNVS